LPELVVDMLDSRQRPISIPLFLQSFLRLIKLPFMSKESVQFFGDIGLLNSTTDEYSSSFIFMALLFFVIMIWIENLRLCFIGGK
jgi:hypothetical protein